MPHAEFVHLRVHSAYSLSEGAIKIKELVALSQRHRMPAVAVTDTGNLFGALEFALAARDAGVQQFIGCQLALAREEGNGNAGPMAPMARRQPDQLVVLAQDEAGYRNLLKLVSQSFLDGEPGAQPQLSLAALEGRSDGLIALTGGPDIVLARQRNLAADDRLHAGLGAGGSEFERAEQIAGIGDRNGRHRLGAAEAGQFLDFYRTRRQRIGGMDPKMNEIGKRHRGPSFLAHHQHRIIGSQRQRPPTGRGNPLRLGTGDTYAGSRRRPDSERACIFLFSVEIFGRPEPGATRLEQNRNKGRQLQVVCA